MEKANGNNKNAAFDTEGFAAFKNSMEDIKGVIEKDLPKFKNLGDQFRTVLDGFKADDSKNIKFIGIDCVAMVFKDNVKIMVVDEAQARKIYGKIGDLDQMFTNLNEKANKLEGQLNFEMQVANNCLDTIQRLEARKIKMFDWWKQIFTGKW